MSRALLAAAWLLVVWGALAFGAVYPWAWRPLIAGAAVVGIAALAAARRRGARADDGTLLAALAAVSIAVCLQLIPLPRAVRTAVSPATEALLLEQDLEYALAVQGAGTFQDAVAAPLDAPARPLTIDPAATRRGLVMFVALVALLAGLTRLLNVTGARRLVTALVVFGALLALFAIVQRALLGDHAYGGMKIYGFWRPRHLLSTPFGPFVNKNHFAGWMLMGVPLAMGLALGWGQRAAVHGGRGWRNALLRLSSGEAGRVQLSALALLVMTVSLLMTRSRSGLAGLAVAMTVGAAVVSRRWGSRRAGLWLATGLVLLFVLAFAWAGTGVATRIADSGGSLELRRNIWSDSVAILRSFPISGTGLDTFGKAMLSYQSSTRQLHFQEAHNDYLQIAVEGGLLLGVPAAVAMVALVASIRRRFASGEDDGMTWWLRVGAATGLLAIALQSAVEFSLQLPGNAVMFVVLGAIALHRAPRRRTSFSDSR